MNCSRQDRSRTDQNENRNDNTFFHLFFRQEEPVFQNHLSKSFRVTDIFQMTRNILQEIFFQLACPDYPFPSMCLLLMLFQYYIQKNFLMKYQKAFYYQKAKKANLVFEESSVNYRQYITVFFFG